MCKVVVDSIKCNWPFTGLAGKSVLCVEATAFAYCQLVPSWTLNNSVLDVSSQDSPLEKLVNPVGALLGWVEPTCIGPTLIKPVLGEAILSA